MGIGRTARASAAILNDGGMREGTQQQTFRVYQEVENEAKLPIAAPARAEKA